jgi:hypothetical protein
MRQNPQQLAWTVLLSAFASFCLLAIGCPLSVRGYLLNARQPLHAQASAQQGTVRVERGGGQRVDAVSLDDPLPLQMFKTDGLRTGNLDECLLTLQRNSQVQRETLVSVVVYDNSDLLLVDASSPRFEFNTKAHTAMLQLQKGRTRIEIQPANDGRPVQVEVQANQVYVKLNEGSYALEVTNQQTMVTVRAGQALVRSGDETLTLTDTQRAVLLSEGTLKGPLPAEQNLIVNGDFDQGLQDGWITYASDPSAQVSLLETDGQPVARFQHDLPEPSEVSLVQTLNRNVRDLQSLVLHLQVRVDYHSLSVCGSQGTECPVMVRIDYVDVAGGNRQWVHGFYAFEDPALSSELPYYCLTCPEPTSGNHHRVPKQSWFLYDSPNLMETLPPEIRPATIQSVRIYASGHNYDSMVTGIELLAQE